MTTVSPVRRTAGWMASAICLLCVAALPAQPGSTAPPPARPPAQGNGQLRPNSSADTGAANFGRPKGEHLSQWMQQHGNMAPTEQQRALENEPGFHQLPAETQQRVRDRLQRLNTMPPQQRERVLDRSEAMERLSPQQRGDVRNAMGQLSGLPQDRRKLVARSFRDLRTMPVPQRNAMLNSPQYRQQFSDEERGTLGNLLAVSPLLPPSN